MFLWVRSSRGVRLSGSTLGSFMQAERPAGIVGEVQLRSGWPSLSSCTILRSSPRGPYGLSLGFLKAWWPENSQIVYMAAQSFNTSVPTSEEEAQSPTMKATESHFLPLSWSTSSKSLPNIIKGRGSHPTS